ncbi:MAG TPA: aryl-sulfate sulfotransferase [Hanamia sp.]|nr:aryl-sulfate sulfotransferase [Hanamia sp.]
MKPKELTNALIISALSVIILWGCQKNTIKTANNSNSNKDSIPFIDSTLYTVTGSGGQDTGEIFEAFNNTNGVGTLAILDQKGYVIKEKNIDSRVDDFQKWTINGQTRYSYLMAPAPYTTGGPTSEEGYDVICDSNFNQLSEAKFLSPGNIDNPDNDRLDVHDFILLGDNHYMAISDQIESPTNVPDSLHPSSKLRVTACIIQEVNNGRVVFQWDGTNYPELYSSSVENNDFSDSTDVMDYMHMNSICIDSTDNNIICSFRNLNEIIKINHVTGAIMWRLGGPYSDFPLSSDELFLRQHYVRFTDNGQTLMFVDNGQISLRPYTRILEFQLNESAKVIDGFKFYNIPDNFIQYAGSVKKMNGNYFIGGGSANYTLQVNYTTNQVYLRMNQVFASYRALKY